MRLKIATIIITMIISSCINNKKREINYLSVKNMEDITDTLHVFNESNFKIYCTGELSPEWANMSTRYIGQDDDIEIFFRKKDGARKKMILKAQKGKKDSTILDYDKVGYSMKYDKINRKYIAYMIIPCSLVVDQLAIGSSFKFDVAIGDNDDGIKQKSKLSWASENDPLYEKAFLGEIIMGDDNYLKNSASTAFATSIKENLNNIESLPKYRITKIVAGQINNPNDLSGYFQVGWDNINIYLRFEVSDSKEGLFKEHNLLNDDCFVDKGWIEDQNGKKIWEMTLKHSISAGGAQKNQYCDTLLKLKKGKYVVKYVSDESHSLGSWDAPKPIKQLWGISISQCSF